MPGVVQAARENPNGWVYKIEGTYGPTEYVPPEAIVGAWKVDAHGNLNGEFMPLNINRASQKPKNNHPAASRVDLYPSAFLTFL
ncbi:hypothetical protein [Ralstonia solanacearum]|uniref:hypothetical protein n=1 Tax=Ralstonia pseudosolanacearum TaxID=1310165 RepID=UPI001FF8FEF7